MENRKHKPGSGVVVTQSPQDLWHISPTPAWEQKLSHWSQLEATSAHGVGALEGSLVVGSNVVGW